MTKPQLPLVRSEPISQPPCPFDEPAGGGDVPDAATTPLSADGALVPPVSPSAAPKQTWPAKRSELGGMQTITQAPELARTVPSQFVSHPHVHVEGQSESTLHGPVCWAAQVFHETLVHVVPASQMEGI